MSECDGYCGMGCQKTKDCKCNGQSKYCKDQKPVSYSNLNDFDEFGYKRGTKSGKAETYKQKPIKIFNPDDYDEFGYKRN